MGTGSSKKGRVPRKTCLRTPGIRAWLGLIFGSCTDDWFEKATVGPRGNLLLNGWNSVTKVWPVYQLALGIAAASWWWFKCIENQLTRRCTYHGHGTSLQISNAHEFSEAKKRQKHEMEYSRPAAWCRAARQPYLCRLSRWLLARSVWCSLSIKRHHTYIGL